MRQPRRLPVWAAAACAAVSVAAAGCGGDDSASPQAVRPSPKTTVVLADGAYRPATVRIRTGSRVTWVNRNLSNATVETEGAGFFEYDRNKLAARGRFDLHTLSEGEADTVRFDVPGRYRYHSSFDDTMRGTVVVVGEPSP